MPEESSLMFAVNAEIAPRTIDTITDEIIAYKNLAGKCIFEIGQRLNEAKAQLSHGEWLPWLEEKVRFSERSANNYMRIAKEYGKSATVADLGYSKALELLALPAFERDEFLAEKHPVNGEEKTVSEMSRKELQQVIKERDEARKKAEAAESAEAEAMAEIEKMRAEIDDLEVEVEKTKIEAEKAKSQATTITVTEMVRDKEFEEKAAAQLAATEEKLAKAKAAKLDAENELAKMKASQAESDKHSEVIRQNMAKQIEDLQKQLAMASSADMSAFKLYFEQIQQTINKMLECIKRVEASDAASAEKLRSAVKALFSSTEGVM